MQDYPFQNFYQIISHNATHNSCKTIIYDGKLTLSNYQLKKHVDMIAAYLKNIEVKLGDKVALVMENSWQYIANIFAISKLGAIVVPVNNFLKEDELAYILNDAQVKILFSAMKFAHETKELLIKTTVQKIIWVDGAPIENNDNIDFKQLINYNAAIAIDNYHDSTLDDVAVIVYTSGTTGKPKGAMLSFKNILSNAAAAMQHFAVKNGQMRMISYLPMFHVFSFTVTIIIPIYSNSGIVVIRSINNKRDFKYLLIQLLLKRCRYFTGVPDIYSVMSRAKLPWYFHYFHNVRGFISGAAPLSEEVIRRFNKNFPRGKLVEGYGVSECSPVVAGNSPQANKIGSVGKALPGYQVKIFNEQMVELATDTVGEICVKGDCVMQGYYNRPDETQEAIINGWFKTGDMGKIDQDGFIFIVDRKKDLIIHKGMNIYPREIEEILYTHSKINAAAVVGVCDHESNELTVAYVELREGETITENEIKEFIKPHLANFKQPRRVIFLEKLPRNATGKILKRELRELKIK